MTWRGDPRGRSQCIAPGALDRPRARGRPDRNRRLDQLFGLVGGDSSKAQRLNTCLQNHGVNIASLATSVGDPTTLLRGAKATDQLIHQAAKNNQIKNGEARTVMTCLNRIDR